LVVFDKVAKCVAERWGVAHHLANDAEMIDAGAGSEQITKHPRSCDPRAFVQQPNDTRKWERPIAVAEIVGL